MQEATQTMDEPEATGAAEPEPVKHSDSEMPDMPEVVVAYAGWQLDPAQTPAEGRGFQTKGDALDVLGDALVNLGWQITGRGVPEGILPAERNHSQKADAVAAGKDSAKAAKPCRLVVKDSDGLVIETKVYR